MSLQPLTFLILLLSVFYSNNNSASFPPWFPIPEGRINYYEIGPNEDKGSEVDESNFFKIIFDLYNLYKNESQRKGRNLSVGIADWKQSYFSAWAFQDTENNYTINFWGGFARLPGMTNNSFALTVCHEIGHILGGHPYHKKAADPTMTSEGQSDYFAAATCLKAYNRKFKLTTAKEISPIVSDKCYKKFRNSKENFEECLSIADAGLSLSRVLALLGNVEDPLFETPSKRVVQETLFDSYPTVQCRLDTLLAGALSNFNPADILNTPKEAVRPSCWFKSEK